MEHVVSILDKQLTSTKAQSSSKLEHGPSQRLLHSPSIDSMGEVRSPGNMTPSDSEPWGPSSLLSTVGAAVRGSPEIATTPFAAAAQLPLDDADAIVVAAEGQKLHALSGNPRYTAARREQNASEAAERWRKQTTLLLLWFAAGVATIAMSLVWFPLGLWAGILGVAGAAIGVCGPHIGVSLLINLQAVCVLSVCAGACVLLAAALLLLLSISLSCPNSIRDAQQCGVFRTALVAMALWYSLQAFLAGLVAARASQIKALIEPVAHKVIVLRPARSTPA